MKFAYKMLPVRGNLRFRFAFLCVAAFACSAHSVAQDSLSGIGDVRLKGYLGNRLDLMIERHVASYDVDYVVAPFLVKAEKNKGWQSEFWGKWMHYAVPFMEYLRDGKCGTGARLKEMVEKGIASILSSQEGNGYIGNYPDNLRCGEGWDVWGIKYTMMGLLHYYDVVKSESAIVACKRLCDYVISEIGPNGKRGRELWQTGNWSGYASSSILEPVVWLYKQTKEKKYLDFATYIVKGMVEPESGPRLVDLALKGVSVADRNGYGNTPDEYGGYVRKHSRIKAYEMMSCYQGLLEYCEAASGADCRTPVPLDDIRRAAVLSAEDIAKEEVNLAGGATCGEWWFHGAKKQHRPHVHVQETCATITWMRFCEKLLETTSDSKWADMLERSFYNAYLGALRDDGSEFASYTPLSGTRGRGMHHCHMHTDCCTANGPRGFLCFLRKFFLIRNGAAEVNFYGSALLKGEMPSGRKVAFEMYSLYPRFDSVRIVSHTESYETETLRLRIPGWSSKTQIKVNGEVLCGAKNGGYFPINRRWKLGDVVEVKFDMPVVAHTLDRHLAFTRGPVLLARDNRFDDGDMMEPFRRGVIEDGMTMSAFSEIRVPSDDFWMAFSATLPIGFHHENPESCLPAIVFFCDYASAGNAWSRKNYYRTWFPIECGQRE